ncbi:MAG: hypothetical protein MJ007_04885 [Paludibacteraceae bacterium]|nr:hypothetical protein [Paludibacteraceae bacterium]
MVQSKQNATVNTATQEKTVYTVKVKTAFHLPEKRRYVFNASVNGVHIEGLAVQEYTNKDGVDGSMICYPSRKGKDKEGNEKWYNTVWFPVSREMLDDIERQIGELLDK